MGVKYFYITASDNAKDIKLKWNTEMKQRWKDLISAPASTNMLNLAKNINSWGSLFIDDEELLLMIANNLSSKSSVKIYFTSDSDGNIHCVEFVSNTIKHFEKRMKLATFDALQETEDAKLQKCLDVVSDALMKKECEQHMRGSKTGWKLFNTLK